MLCKFVEMYQKYEKIFRHLPFCCVRPWFPPWWCTPTGGYSLKTILSHHHLENKRHNRDHFSLSLQEANTRNLKTFRLHYFYLFIMPVTYLYEIRTQFSSSDLTSLTGCKIFLIWQQRTTSAAHYHHYYCINSSNTRLCLRIWMNKASLIQPSSIFRWTIHIK